MGLVREVWSLSASFNWKLIRILMRLSSLVNDYRKAFNDCDL